MFSKQASVIDELYKVSVEEGSESGKEVNEVDKPVEHEGYIERLPYGQDRKSTLRTWKQQYLRVRNGILYCYESARSEEPLQLIELRGGFASATSETQFILDNQRSEVCLFRATSAAEAARWIEVLGMHFGVSAAAHAVVQQPALRAPESVRSLAKTGSCTIIIDLGTSSVRAGLLGPSRSAPSLPTFFSPACVATASGSSTVVAFGSTAYDIPTRHRCSVKTLLSPQVLSAVRKLLALLLIRVFHV